jgi:hypothetical protein
LEFIQKLALHCIFGDETVLGVVLRSHAGSVFVDLCDTECDVVKVVQWVLVESSEIGSGYIPTTLDEMARDKSASELVVICVFPRVPVYQGKLADTSSFPSYPRNLHHAAPITYIN